MSTLTHPAAEAATLHIPGTDPEIVDVPERLLLMIDGEGAPGSPRFQAALQGLFSIAYGLKFSLRRQGITTPPVAPLETLWDVHDWDLAIADHPDDIRWRAMIAMPEVATPELVREVARDAAERKGITAAGDVRLRRWREGLCAEVLHVGPYADEGATVARLHEAIAAHGCEPTGKHHEIYLGDPRRVAPERLRTIIRHPMRRR